MSAPAASPASSASTSSSSTSSTTGKRKNRNETYVTLNLEELNKLFLASSSSSASSASSSSSSSSSSAKKPIIDANYIKSAYRARNSDMQKTIDDLVEATGLHPEMHSRHALDSYAEKEEERKYDDAGDDDEDTSTTPSSSSSSSNPLKKQRSLRLQFSQVSGDLFSSPASSALAHCVSECLAMGKGIATLFKNKFGGVDELKAQKQKEGGCAVLKKDGRYVYYLITKKRYFNKPTYDSLERSLRVMRSHMLDHGVKLLSMPRIGCGLDGLLWQQVVEIIQKVFGDDDVRIVVYTM